MTSVGTIRKNRTANYAFLGELSLDGSVNRINGALPLVIGLRNQGVGKIILPAQNAEEASAIDDVSIFPVRHLKEIAAYFDGEYEILPYRKQPGAPQKASKEDADFSDVAGQESVKRALQVAAAASHNVLLIGPPGAGKTMMARRVSGILPAMTYEEKLEVTKIYSIAGELSPDWPYDRGQAVPLPSPYHLRRRSCGRGKQSPNRGRYPWPHYGVLFLDELPEFNRYVLEMLRQPLEDERVNICRVRGTTTFPAKFMLLASMNPCPCGYYGDPTHECTCGPNQIRNYLSRISGPLLDRIDMHIEIMPVRYKDLAGTDDTDAEADGLDVKAPRLPERNSEAMRQEVEAARQIQLERYKNEEIAYNSQLTPGLMNKYCVLDRETKKLMETVVPPAVPSVPGHIIKS